MFSLQKLIILLLAFISHEYEARAQYSIPYTSSVVQVNKHTDFGDLPLYSVEVITAWEVPQHKKAKFLIDIDAPFTWHDCIVQWDLYHCPTNMLCEFAVSCDEDLCTEVRSSYSYKNVHCRPVTNSTTLPNGGGYCSCSVNVVDPIDGSCSQALLNYENLFINTCNGRNPYDAFSVPTLNSACLPSSSFKSFPANVSGVMALSTSNYALPASLTDFNRAIAFCLPSTTSAPGVLFFGNASYYFMSHTDVDIRSFLSYTPLLKQPDSFGYFIGINAIVIKRRSIEVPSTTTTKLSTIQPYTTLRTDIYNSVIRRFSEVTKRIPLAKPVSPFGLCFKSFTNGTGVGLKVPDIDFSLQEGEKWSISASNSIKQVTNDVACLAFVDGGATSEHAIVIGTFQFEDNFLLFDLENSTLGFSSSLLSKKTSCADFNFTIIPYKWF